MAPKKYKIPKKGKAKTKKKKGKKKGKKGKKTVKKPVRSQPPINGSALIYKYAFDNEENFLKSIPEFDLRRDTYVLFKEPLPPPPPEAEPQHKPEAVKKPAIKKFKRKKGKNKAKKRKGKKGKTKKDGADETDGKAKKGKSAKKKKKKPGKGKSKKKSKKKKVKDGPILRADDPVDGVIQQYLAFMQMDPLSQDINYITVDVHTLTNLIDDPFRVDTLPTLLKWGEIHRLCGTKECTNLALFGLFVDPKDVIDDVVKPSPQKKKPKKKGKGKLKGKGKKKGKDKRKGKEKGKGKSRGKLKKKK